MAANELKEAVQALAWVQLSGELGLLTEGGIRLRAQCGFRQRVIASESPKDFGLLIFLLERVHTRRESALIVAPVGTTDAAGNNYPQLLSAAEQLEEPARAPIVQPIMLEWLGPDLSNPDWLPFGSDVLPSSFDADLFDAIAVQVPANGVGSSLAGDFCLLLYKVPPLPSGAAASVEPVLPVSLPPVPIVAVSESPEIFAVGTWNYEALNTVPWWVDLTIDAPDAAGWRALVLSVAPDTTHYGIREHHTGALVVNSPGHHGEDNLTPVLDWSVPRTIRLIFRPGVSLEIQDPLSGTSVTPIVPGPYFFAPDELQIGTLNGSFEGPFTFSSIWAL